MWWEALICLAVLATCGALAWRGWLVLVGASEALSHDDEDEEA